MQQELHGGPIPPVLDFIFLPLTTIVEDWELNSGMRTVVINLLWLPAAVIVEPGRIGPGRASPLAASARQWCTFARDAGLTTCLARQIR
jgi:hypothetical protein